MGYSRQAMKGVSWLGAFRLLFRSFSYIKLAIIARILSPESFGAADVAIIVLAFVEIITETGINVFLIQEKDDIDDYINTAWVISIVRGFLVGILVYLCSSLISAFFHSTDSQWLLVLISIVPIVRGFINPSVIKFLKDLEYNKQFYYKSSIAIIEVISVIFFVLLLRDASGIVWGMVISAIWEVMLTFMVASPRPLFSFSLNIFFKIIKRGKWLTFAGIFDYLYLNLDNIIVGRLLGTSSLGLYMRAYGLSLLPITEISDVFNQATFPIYVKMRNDTERLKNAFFKTLMTVAVCVIPVGLLFYMFPREIIRVVLGDQWISSVVVLQTLAFYGIIRAILRTAIGFFYSLQRQDIVTKLTAINLIGLAVTVIPFINLWGLVGAGLSAVFGTVLSIPFTVYYVNSVLKNLKTDA